MTTVELERPRLAVGDMLAEGGEGRVHELRDRPDALFKAYRVPVDAEPLRGLVAWPGGLAADRPDLARRVASASAWPATVVVDPPSGRAAGLVIPRAPARFWLRHRDGALRLASLSYLTADPGQRAAAYGLDLPPPMSAARVGLAYALARLIEALEGADRPAAHGDLSARNVLWSLERGPEVFVIDCDNAELYGEDGEAEAGDRRRASTPNWDDPAVPAGANPGRFSDRYSLALIFLRVAGAAHFPIQARQRRDEPVAIDFDVPAAARHLPALSRSAPLWRLAAWGLDVADPTRRPAAGAWACALQEVLEDMGAAAVVRQVWSAQEGLAHARPSVTADAPPPGMPPAVRVRPVGQTPRTQAWRVVTAGDAAGPGMVASQPVGPTVRRYARYVAVWWWLAHKRTARSFATRGTRGLAVRRLVTLLLADFALACIGLFLFAMIVSPFLGL